jgi:hypothetical protein
MSESVAVSSDALGKRCLCFAPETLPARLAALLPALLPGLLLLLLPGRPVDWRRLRAWLLSSLSESPRMGRDLREEAERGRRDFSSSESLKVERRFLLVPEPRLEPRRFTRRRR